VGLQWTPESDYVKELAKWEQRPTELVSAGMLQALGKPISPPYQEFPKAMYRAIAATGGPAINGFMVAHDASQERLLTGQGWSSSQDAAIELVHAADRAMAQAAAERAFSDRVMGEKARLEAQRVDDSTPAHVPEIPHTPIRKRQKRAYVRKAVPVTAQE